MCASTTDGGATLPAGWGRAAQHDALQRVSLVHRSWRRHSDRGLDPLHARPCAPSRQRLSKRHVIVVFTRDGPRAHRIRRISALRRSGKTLRHALCATFLPLLRNTSQASPSIHGIWLVKKRILIGVCAPLLDLRLALVLRVGEVEVGDVDIDLFDD